MSTYMLLAGSSKDWKGSGWVVRVELDVEELGEVWGELESTMLASSLETIPPYPGSLIDRLTRDICSHPVGGVSTRSFHFLQIGVHTWKMKDARSRGSSHSAESAEGILDG